MTWCRSAGFSKLKTLTPLITYLSCDISAFCSFFSETERKTFVVIPCFPVLTFSVSRKRNGINCAYIERRRQNRYFITDRTTDRTADGPRTDRGPDRGPNHEPDGGSDRGSDRRPDHRRKKSFKEKKNRL